MWSSTERNFLCRWRNIKGKQIQLYKKWKLIQTPRLMATYDDESLEPTPPVLAPGEKEHVLVPRMNVSIIRMMGSVVSGCKASSSQSKWKGMGEEFTSVDGLASRLVIWGYLRNRSPPRPNSRQINNSKWRTLESLYIQARVMMIGGIWSNSWRQWFIRLPYLRPLTKERSVYFFLTAPLHMKALLLTLLKSTKWILILVVNNPISDLPLSLSIILLQSLVILTLRDNTRPCHMLSIIKILLSEASQKASRQFCRSVCQYGIKHWRWIAGRCRWESAEIVRNPNLRRVLKRG